VTRSTGTAPGGAGPTLAVSLAPPAGVPLPEIDLVAQLSEPQPRPIPLLDASAEPALNVLTGRIGRGTTVGAALAERGVPGPLVHAISQSLRPVFDFRRARPGDFFTLIRDPQDNLLSFEYQYGRERLFRVRREATGELVASADSVPLERRVVQLAGIVEGSVFSAITELGEGADLVQSFADVFIWDIDFSKQVRPGDEFRMVVEKFYDPKGFVRYGRILAADYRTAGRTHTAVYYEDDAGNGDYFTPDGRSVRRSFLRAPLKYSRISSRYTYSRLHPVLKFRRPHLGVDYAAPTGTPVWAVAEGQVIFAGWQGGFGRLVKIRHHNGYVSYYGHLSRYGAGLRVGQRVRQKQVIGYVGASGLATGPHLDFRVQINGRYVDPLRLDFPSGEPIPMEERERFEEVKDLRLAELREAQPPVTLEAAL
jgi:murein DD-endopeptidase MepM/ murein hydrolase activator NlpD